MSVSGGLTIGMDEQSAVAIMGECDPVKKEWQKYVVIDKVWGDRLLLMPIPTSAMDVNPLLKDDQNPGY